MNALPDRRPADGLVQVEMRDEALETHVAREVALLAVPCAPGFGVARAGDRFYTVRREWAPEARDAGDNDCLRAVAAADGEEDHERVDPTDLGRRTGFLARFPAARPGARLALLVRARNSLAGAHVFYQLLAWLGAHAGEAMLALGPGDALGRALHAAVDQGRAVARIDVAGRGAGACGSRRAVSTSSGRSPWRRRPCRGPPCCPPRPPARAWRSGCAWRRASGGSTASPSSRWTRPRRWSGCRSSRRAAWHRTSRSGARATDRRARRSPGAETRAPVLVTSSGDRCALRFEAPPIEDAASFVEATAHYFEWMREDWPAEKNLSAAGCFLADPARGLRDLAPRFAEVEEDADRVLWSTRISGRAEER